MQDKQPGTSSRGAMVENHCRLDNVSSIIVQARERRHGGQQKVISQVRDEMNFVTSVQEVVFHYHSWILHFIDV